MTNVQEFSVATECVTASMTLPMECGEHYGPPLTIGIYPGQKEIWIKGEMDRQNIPVQHVPAVIRQLRRAAKIAAEHSEANHDR